MIINNRLQKYILCFLIILFSIICVYNISSSPFKDWDESRHIVNALQMMDSGNFIVNWWGSSPDMWNLKPPVSFWTIILFSATLGKSLLTLRMASIVSGVLLVSICSYLAARRYGYVSAIIFMLLVLSCRQMMMEHGFRTADPDSVYLLFSIVSVIYLSMGYSVKNISLAALLISLAFLTKSWHALSFGFAFITAYTYMLRYNGITTKLVLIPLTCFFLPIIMWLSIRYQYDGFVFIKKMIDYDLLHRSSSQIEGHRSNAWFYINALFSNYLSVMIAFISSLTISLLRNGFKKTFSYDIVILIVTIVTLITFFTLAETRLSWYGYPHTLLLCFTSAILFSKIKKPWVLLLLVLLPMSLFQIKKTINKASDNFAPDYYKQLSLIKSDNNNDINIHIPNDTSQSERAAIMVYGGFSQRKIKYNSSDRNYYLFSRNNSKVDNVSPACEILSSGEFISIFKCIR
ncbi:glycosyltransferase family 39 protein [Buttiauxella sp. S04-F03]|uniref:ArnT family glycosyltransferase n=1 Tax=Buttiauxella sp. S04-F03 TaxID=2904525 RepID=UPI001E3B27EC|nr:glycosyltransferase family 39 protein [Buttiauxella sp. S04-F03]MCE0810905.1 glycosyltransferase family 39 protein [Buttiauxella sp. S04-F03]